MVAWLDTSLSGRPCRGVLAALIARQYWEPSESIADNLRTALQCLAAAVTWLPDRVVKLHPPSSRPTIIYNDAFAEGRKVRIGALVLTPGHTPQALVYDPPDSVIASWGPQETIQAESHAAPLLAWSAPELLCGRDVIWILDNTSAECALAKACSPTESMCRLALLATASLAGLGHVSDTSMSHQQTTHPTC